MIEVKNLCYTYEKKSAEPAYAVKNINFKLESGEILGIIGKTGSGKSTLVQMLCGLIKPCEGEIILNGENINKHFKKNSDICFKIGIVFQYPETQLFEKTVFDDIAFALRNKELPESEIAKIVHETADFMGIPHHLLNRSPLNLSGGEKRKCATAGVIAMKPEILILDEPTSALDPNGKAELMEFLKKYHKKSGGIIILISHIMEEIAEICDKVLVMDKGKAAASGDAEKLLSDEELLKSVGLDCPQTIKIMKILNKSGYNFKENIITAKKAQKAILSHLNEGGVHF